MAPKTVSTPDEAVAKAGETDWRLVSHPRGVAEYWMGGYARNPSLLQPLTTKFKRFAARLTQAEAAAELDGEPRMVGMGFVAERIGGGGSAEREEEIVDAR